MTTLLWREAGSLWADRVRFWPRQLEWVGRVSWYGSSCGFPVSKIYLCMASGMGICWVERHLCLCTDDEHIQRPSYSLFSFTSTVEQRPAS